MSDKMSRDMNQIMNNFLKGAIFRHAKEHYSCKVQEIDHRNPIINLGDKYPKKYIGFIIERSVPPNADYNFLTRDEEPNYKIVKPKPDDWRTSVDYSIFPLTFKCSNCRILNKVSYDRSKNIRTYENICCRNCGYKMGKSDQMYKVLVCSCGNIQGLRSPTHCDEPMALDAPSKRLSDAAWYCSECNKSLDFYSNEINISCNKCNNRLYDDSTRVLPSSSSKTYYIQSSSILNADERLDNINKKSFRKGILDRFLDKDIDVLTEDEENIFELYKAGDKGAAESLLDISDTTKDLDQIVRIGKEKSEDPLHKRISGQKIKNIYEYTTIKQSESFRDNGCKIKPIEEIESISSSLLRKYKDRNSDLGIKQTSLVKNLESTKIAYGYTRLEPDPVDGGKFVAFEGRDNEKRVFVSDKKVEAVLFELSLDNIVDWITKNLSSYRNPTQKENRKFILENFKDPSFNNSETNEHHEQFFVYNLLHSYSHALLDAIGQVSGYSTRSLQERIFPAAGSILIYKKPTNDFTLGALYSAVENNYLEILDRVERKEICPRDPICSHSDRARCENCILIPKYACSNYRRNQNLSRDYLFTNKDSDILNNGYFQIN